MYYSIYILYSTYFSYLTSSLPLTHCRWSSATYGGSYCGSSTAGVHVDCCCYCSHSNCGQEQTALHERWKLEFYCLLTEIHILFENVKRYSFAVKCTAYCLSPNSLGFFRNILYLSLVSRWQNNKLWILITYFQQDKAHNISVKGKLNCRYNISQQVHVYLYCLQCSYMQTSLLSTEKTCYTVWPSWT